MTEPNSENQRSDSQVIRKRTVVLLPGFDPRGASHYRKMLSEQFSAYAAREGFGVEVTPRKRWKQHWHRWNIATDTCRISFLYAEWDDIVRKYWHRGRLELFLDSCRTYLTYLSSLRFIRGCSSTSYSQIGFYYPLVSFLFLYLLLMSGMGMAAWYLAKLSNIPAGGMAASVAAGIVCAIFLAHKISPRLNGGWLLRIFCFTKKIACEGVPEWDSRAPVLAEDLVEQLSQDPPDELLVVGHSVGAIKAINLLEELLKKSSYTGRVSYMAIGQCLQLVTYLEKNDGKFNRSLREVAENPRVDWVDFTMPSDGACIALQDPIRASLDPPPNYPNADSPKFLSPRLMEGYSKERFKELKRNHFEYHFQYYKTPDSPAEYEFAAIVLGDKPLAARFANRKNQARNRQK
ncbi:MAG: hypothetical protein V4727_08460 [Verrucomicrobiota bacterium]